MSAVSDICDLQAEEYTLGAALVNPRAYAEIAERVSASDFYRGSNGEVFTAIGAAIESLPTVDAMAVADVLERSGRLNDIGGRVRIADLMNAVPSSTQGAYYAQRVSELARRRRVVAVSHQLAADAADPTVDIDEALQGRVEDLLTSRRANGIIRVQDVSERLWELRTKGRKSQGVSTGWQNVDRLYRVVPGQMSIVSGIPSHGKSAWVDALCVNLSALHGWRIALYSPESAPTEDHLVRLVSLRSGVDFDRIDHQRLVEVEGWLRDRFVWVDHDSYDRVAGILAQVRAEHDRRPLDAFVLDPWTELDMSRQKGVREDEMISAELTRIRRFARRHGIHAFVIAHPKQIDKRADGTFPVPTSADLHGGSVWRKKADMLVVVWRDEEGRTRPETTVDVHVQKVRRNGVDGLMGRRTELRFDSVTGQYQLLTDRKAPL